MPKRTPVVLETPGTENITEKLKNRVAPIRNELPEFHRDALEALRQPLEEGNLTVIRARGRFTFPARFALLASMNP